jgi:hypothetical protein
MLNIWGASVINATHIQIIKNAYSDSTMKYMVSRKNAAINVINRQAHLQYQD